MNAVGDRSLDRGGNFDRSSRFQGNQGFTGYGQDFGSNYGSDDRGFSGNYGNQEGFGGYYGRSDRGSGRNQNEGGFGGGYGNEQSYGNRYSNEQSNYWQGSDSNNDRDRYGTNRGGQSDYRQGQSQSRLESRGPKNYRRSDERIREEVCDRLMQGGLNAEEVEVQVKDGQVTLSGTVDNRQDKRAIEDLAEEILGVKEVQNQLRIQRGELSSRSEKSSASSASGSQTSGEGGSHKSSKS